MSTAFAKTGANSRARFVAGARDMLPLLFGVAPFGMIYGVLALAAGLPPSAAQAMSALVLAGSAQFVAVQLIGSGAPGLLILLTTFVINLRHVLYSASLAPHLSPLGRGWKWLLAYLLVDETFALAAARYARASDPSPRTGIHWYTLGAGATLWATWQASTAAGLFLGARVPDSWSLDFALPLTFIAIVVPGLRSAPSLAAAGTAGLIAVLGAGAPYKLGLVAAALTGIVTGLIVERRA